MKNKTFLLLALLLSSSALLAEGNPLAGAATDMVKDSATSAAKDAVKEKVTDAAKDMLKESAAPKDTTSTEAATPATEARQAADSSAASADTLKTQVENAPADATKPVKAHKKASKKH
ncbi:MAG: hypothetical protein ABL903_03045 [Methylococcales bacterium]